MAAPITSTKEELARENQELRARLSAVEAKLAETEDKHAASQEVLRAIQSGEVDAVVVSRSEGDRIFTLKGAEYAYRALVESMNEGAATLDCHGTVLYCNHCFASLVAIPLEQVIGHDAAKLFESEAGHTFQDLFMNALSGETAKAEFELIPGSGPRIPVYVSLREMKMDDPTAVCMVVTDLREIKKRDELLAAQEALRENETRLSELVAAQREIASANVSYAGLRQLILDRMSLLTNADGASLEIAEGDDEMLYEAATGIASGFVGLRLKIAGSLTGLCMTSNQLLRSDDIEEDPRVDRDACRRIGLRSMLVLPLRYGERSFGVLKMMSARVGAFTEDAEQRLALMSEFLGVTIARQRAVEALRDSEQRLRLAQQAAKIGAFELNLQTDVNVWSPEMDAIYGLAPGEFGRTDAAFYSLVHADDRHGIAYLAQLSAKTGEPVEGEWRIVWRDGSIHWVLGRFQVFYDESRQPLRLIGVNIDISERKRAEEELRLATERFQVALKGSSIVVFNQDLDLRYTWIYNPALGYDATAVLGKRDVDLFGYTEDGEATEALKRKVIRTGISQREEVLVRWEGTDRYYDLQVDPLRNADGSIAGVTCAAVDVTERKQAQQALLRSEKLASVGRMAATIAHEINNPLASVTNSLFLASGVQDLPTAAREYLAIADQELKRVAHITRQALGFYRESSAPVPTPVAELLESVLDLLKNRINTKCAHIEKQWNEELSITAVTGEIRQVFSNIVSNSLDAIEKHGSIKLRVSNHTILDGRKAVRITIADDGKGIAQSSQDRVFEPFFTTKGELGTGLGLWVSKQIIEKHEGIIRVRSSVREGRTGTIVSVVLPVQGSAKVRKSAETER